MLCSKGTSVGAGDWALPGGHLEWGESFEECAVRELYEETGIQLLPTSATFVHAVNAVFPDSKSHYVTIFMKIQVSQSLAAQIRTMEPNKCEGWEWHKANAVASESPLFLPLELLLKEKSNLLDFI
jgi:8-oxo-dGTP diphosphatase